MTFKSWILTSEKKDQVARIGVRGGGFRGFGQCPKENVFFSLMSSLIPRLFWDKIFRDQYWDFFRSNFFRPIPRLFCRPKFSRSILRLLLRPILRLFLRLKFFEADTETFFKTKFFETNTLGKNEKSFDTEKSRDEMSHSDLQCKNGCVMRCYWKGNVAQIPRQPIFQAWWYTGA